MHDCYSAHLQIWRKMFGLQLQAHFTTVLCFESAGTPNLQQALRVHQNENIHPPVQFSQEPLLCPTSGNNYCVFFTRLLLL